MRRSQGRRSSNILPIRPLSFAGPTSSSNKMNSQPSTQPKDGQKRASSIPRPSISSTMGKLGSSRTQDASLPLGTTPSKSSSILRNPMTMATPQMGKSPQNRGTSITNSVAKSFARETRNLTDKNSIKEMMVNVANFFTETGYPELIGVKEIQKIDKQSFTKYFNFMYHHIDRNFQLAPRFNEDELIRHLKEMGYCGTLTRAALVSIGALHSTSQIVALLSWLADFVRMLNYGPEEESYDKVELKLMVNSYNSWCVEAPYDLKAELRALYLEMHELEDGVMEELEQEIAATTEGCRILESKSSQIEELKQESKKLEKFIDELSSKISQLELRLKETNQKDKHNLQRVQEAKEKISSLQNEIVELGIAAKNCKLSAEEARRMRSQIANIRRNIASTSEQRAEVAELFEKRELQLANVAADEAKQTRKLYVELMDMGVTIGENSDRMEKLNEFLSRKPKELLEVESSTLSRIERKGQVSANISLLNLEMKHVDLQKRRYDDDLETVKAEQQEMERIYLSELAKLQNVMTAPRSDPALVRWQLDVDTYREKVMEQKNQMKKQETELELKMECQAAEIKQFERTMKDAEEAAMQYYARLFEGYRDILQAADKGILAQESVKELLPKVDF